MRERAQPDDLERLAELVTSKVLAVIAPLLRVAPGQRYADAGHNPLGSERAFLDAGRRGDFPTFRRSRRVTALWTDVEAWIESRRTKRLAPVPVIPSDDPNDLDPEALFDMAEAKSRIRKEERQRNAAEKQRKAEGKSQRAAAR